MATKPLSLLACVVASSLACSFSYRTERNFDEALDLGDAEHLILRAPQTDLSVRPREDADTALLRGRWYALGGTAKVAEKHAKAATFDVVDYDESVSVEAYWPSDAHGLIELALDALYLPPGHDFSFVGEGGDVDVIGIVEFVDVEVGWGELRVAGLREGADVYTGGGDIELRTDRTTAFASSLRAITLAGDIRVEQNTRGVVIAEAGVGDIQVRIPSDENISLYVYGARGVEVDLPRVRQTLPSGEVRRQLDDGEIEIWVVAHDGYARVFEDPDN